MTALRRSTAALAALLLTLTGLLAGAPLALAQVPRPDPPEQAVITPTQPPPSVISYGSPIWVFVLVAAAAAALTIAAMLTTRQLRHRPHPSAAHA